MAGELLLTSPLEECAFIRPRELAAMQAAFAYSMPFSFDTDISITGTLTTGRMNPVQVLLSDDDEATSFVKGYGGELLRDGFRVSVKAALGQDRGVSIRYGKTLSGWRSRRTNRRSRRALSATARTALQRLTAPIWRLYLPENSHADRGKQEHFRGAGRGTKAVG